MFRLVNISEWLKTVLRREWGWNAGKWAAAGNRQHQLTAMLLASRERREQ